MQKLMLVFLNDQKRWNHEGGEQTEGNQKNALKRRKFRGTGAVSQTEAQSFLSKGGKGIEGWGWEGGWLERWRAERGASQNDLPRNATFLET